MIREATIKEEESQSPDPLKRQEDEFEDEEPVSFRIDKKKPEEKIDHGRATYQAETKTKLSFQGNVKYSLNENKDREKLFEDLSNLQKETQQKREVKHKMLMSQNSRISNRNVKSMIFWSKEKIVEIRQKFHKAKKLLLEKISKDMKELQDNITERNEEKILLSFKKEFFHRENDKTLLHPRNKKE